MITLNSKKGYELCSNLINQENPLTRSLYITGNFYFLENLIKNLTSEKYKDQIKILKINCTEYALSDDLISLFDEILNQLEYKPIKKNTWSKSTEDFILKLNEILNMKKWKTIYIMFNNFEKLKKFSTSELSILANISHYCNLYKEDINLINICISSLPPYKIFGDYLIPELFFINISGFDEREITDIILHEFNDDQDLLNYYTFFVEQMIKTIFTICTDISELKYIIKTSWNLFKQKLESRRDYSDWDLITKLKPLLKESTLNLYARTSLNKMNLSKINELNSSCLQLPFKSRYLLIAAFIASNNHKSMDKILFMKNTGKLSNRQKISIKKRETAHNSLINPRLFTIDRLLAIYSCIVESVTIEYNYCSISRQIQNLIHIRVLIRHQGDLLKNEKFVCVAPFELVSDVAKSVNFEIRNYLLNFN